MLGKYFQSPQRGRPKTKKFLNDLVIESHQAAYKETETSKRARKLFLELIAENPKELAKYNKLGMYNYHPRRREAMSRRGKLNADYVYRTLARERTETSLLKRCMQLNLTGDEVQEVIQFFDRKPKKDFLTYLGSH